MALDRLLIIGNTVLFSTFGCYHPGSGDVEVGTADTGVGDGAIDAGEVIDEGVDPPDGAPIDASATDLAADDMGYLDDLGPQDLGGLDDLGRDDMGEFEDLGPEDFGPEDLGPEDLAPLDEGIPQPDAAPVDVGLDPDMAAAPDLLPPDAGGAMMCADLIGQGCEVSDEGCCVEGSPQAVCWRNETGGLSWQPIPGDFFCNCIPDGAGREMVICAVPGFVGIARAGRRAPVAPSLRALARDRARARLG